MGGQTAKTTERSLAVVNAIQRRDGATLHELTSELEIARSTIHVHLQTLLENGYVEKEGEEYHIGLRFLNHGEYARSRKKAYTLAQKTVDRISDLTEEEVEFVVKNNHQGIVVHESFHPDSHFPSKDSHISESPTASGIYYHLHCVATGKAILAELPEDEVDQVIDAWGLPKQTDCTITNRDELEEQLAAIRERGVAYADEEYVNGLREVGRRIKAPDGSVLGAIAIIGPEYRFTDERYTDELPNILIDQVDKLEEEIEASYVNDLL